MVKKILVWAGIAFIVFFIAFRPDAAASVVNTIGNTAVSIFHGIGEFFSGLVS